MCDSNNDENKAIIREVLTEIPNLPCRTHHSIKKNGTLGTKLFSKAKFAKSSR